MIDVYNEHISIGQKNSLDKIWNYINSNNLATGSENPLTYNRLLFRARENDGKINIINPDTFFHIPFNERYNIGNQRFSISGQPMLYFGNSIICIEKELNSSNLAFAAFLPKYYIYYKKKVFDIKNTIFDVLVKVLPNLFGANVKLDYFNDHQSPNSNSIKKDLQRSILAEILTFPVEIKKSFVEEYVLPQMLTTILMNNNYDGVLFPSTKDFSNLTNSHLFTNFNINTALFVKYDPVLNYDKNLQNTFFIFTFNGNEKLTLSSKDVIDRIELSLKKNHTATQNNNDFVIPLVNTKLHIEYLEKAKLNGISYFDTNEGKIELEFYYKLAEKMESFIK